MRIRIRDTAGNHKLWVRPAAAKLGKSRQFGPKDGYIKYIREAAKKVFFTGLATKAFPPPSSLVAKIFVGFFRASKKGNFS